MRCKRRFVINHVTELLFQSDEEDFPERACTDKGVSDVESSDDDDSRDPSFVVGDDERSGSDRAASPHLGGAVAWKTARDPDTVPEPLRFRPLRTPGVQLDTTVPHSPLDLFKLFFSPASMKKLCANTNKYARKHTAGLKYAWEDVVVAELSRFLGLLVYMSLVSLPSLKDYWKQNHILSMPFPPSVMKRRRFEHLFWNLHISDPEEDGKNDEKKGTPGFNKLLCVQPLLDEVRAACKAHYHPRKELAVDERMVATKAKTGMTQYMKKKPTKWGIKLFVLADSSNGYTVDFNVYIGKSHNISVHGLPYDSVMNLIKPAYLGTGFHIYMDNFYTSSKLFEDLSAMKFGACGTYRENSKWCPLGPDALEKNSPRGSIRWIRRGPIVYVKWMDTREVSVCSTIHPAYAGDTVKRRVKSSEGNWALTDIQCPAPIVAYNKYMGGVDRSDQLIQYYSTRRTTSRWYRTMFFHLLDIATTNSYLMHLELASVQGTPQLTHKDFMVELACQLCGVEKTGAPLERRCAHVPVPCAVDVEKCDRATKGRRRCQNCSRKGVRNVTPWMCKACDVPLCVALDRNCFEEWHRDGGGKSESADS